MSGRHPFDELTKDFTPERRARVDARKAELRGRDACFTSCAGRGR